MASSSGSRRDEKGRSSDRPFSISGSQPRCGDICGPIDEDAEIRENLASLEPGAVADLKRVLEAPQSYRDALLRQFIARPELADLATLIAMANGNEVVRLRLLRAIRDVGS